MNDGNGATTPTYVALGDSISIDEYAGGPGRGGASLFARNRDIDFPDWRGRDLQSLLPGLRWHMLATDGGTTQTLLGSQLPARGRLGVAPAVVTLTVGGNDVLSAYGDTRYALRIVPVVRDRVARALFQLGRLSRPGASVIVGTVYDPSDGTADASRVGLPPWPGVVEVLDRLNAALREVSAEHGVQVAEIHRHFLGHGVSAGNPAQPEPRPGSRELWYCHVIEPNAWGADGVRAAFWEALHRAR